MSRATTTTTTTTFPGRDDEHGGEGECGPVRTISIEIQPRPIRLKIARTTNAAGTSTAIMRTWREGDPARCRLCPASECNVDAGGACLVAVPDYVSDRSAADFSLSAWRARQGVPGPDVDVPADLAGA